MNGFSELVIGFVAPVGTPVSKTISFASEHFDKYGLKTKVIHVPGLFDQGAPVNSRDKLDLLAAKMPQLRQAVGDKQVFGKDETFLTRAVYAYLVIHEISRIRKAYQDDPDCKGVVYLLDTLKHPDEIKLLKQVYEKCFYTIGITSPILRRVENKLDLAEGTTPSDEELESAAAVVYEDYFPNDGNYSNDVSKAYQLSDFFLNDAEAHLQRDIVRFIDLIFGAPNLTPRSAEHSMFMAYMSSLRSGDLSRQVGSTIVNKKFDILAVGVNEVPEASGGQYWAEDAYMPYSDANAEIIRNGHDQRDYALGYDVNASVKTEMLAEIMDVIDPDGTLTESEKTSLLDKLRQTSISDITEFGRVVHAEMSALMSAARNGVSVHDMEMFCTTYPCHNCAKHIIAAGIKQVTYIEPYPKSKALFSHRDAIIDPEGLEVELGAANSDSNRLSNIKKLQDAFTQRDHDSGAKNNNKVIFTSFSGVGPSRYLDLFSMNLGIGEPLKRKNKETGEARKIDYMAVKGPRIATNFKQNMFSEAQFFEAISDDASAVNEQLLVLLEDFRKGFSSPHVSTIKFWNNDEGYGYITSDSEKDYVFRERNLIDGYIPSKGDCVEFYLKSFKGRQYADGVKRVKGSEITTESAPISATSAEAESYKIRFYNSTKDYGYIDRVGSEEKDIPFKRSHLVNGASLTDEELKQRNVIVEGTGKDLKVYLL